MVNGRIDELAIWKDYALSQADVDWLYNLSAGRSYADLQNAFA